MKLLILGAGGYGQTVADMARQSGKYTRVAFLDDNAEGEDILGACSDFLLFRDRETEMYPAFGNNRSRLNWVDTLAAAGISVAALVHPTAYVSPTAKLGAGVMVLPKALVNTGCTVERGCIINCGSIVDHGCTIGAGAHICLGAIVKAENHIPACMKAEAGQVIENRAYPLQRRENYDFLQK